MLQMKNVNFLKYKSCFDFSKMINMNLKKEKKHTHKLNLQYKNVTSRKGSVTTASCCQSCVLHTLKVLSSDCKSKIKSFKQN